MKQRCRHIFLHFFFRQLLCSDDVVIYSYTLFSTSFCEATTSSYIPTFWLSTSFYEATLSSYIPTFFFHSTSVKQRRRQIFLHFFSTKLLWSNDVVIYSYIIFSISFCEATMSSLTIDDENYPVWFGLMCERTTRPKWHTKFVYSHKKECINWSMPNNP